MVLRQPRFRNKTWLYKAGSHFLGVLYEIDSLADARRFVTGCFPAEADRHGPT